MGKEKLNIQVKDLEGFMEQAEIFQSILKTDAPHLLKEFKKLLSYYSYPDIEKHFQKLHIIYERTYRVMDAINEVGRKSKRAMLPEFKGRIITDIWSDETPEKDFSLRDMVFTIIREIDKCTYTHKQSKEFLLKADEFLLQYISRLSTVNYNLYTDTDYNRYIIVGRIACSFGYKLSYKTEVEINSPNKEMFNVVKYALNTKAPK